MTSEPRPGRYADDDHLAGRTLLVAAAYVVVRRGDEVLLQRRAGTGYLDGFWATVAGHVDPGESVHDAAVREVHEEVGLDVDLGDLEPLTTLHRFQRGGPSVEQRSDMFFTVRRWRGEPTLREADRAAELAWFRLDALPDPVVPHERLVLEALAAGAALPAIVSLAT